MSIEFQDPPAQSTAALLSSIVVDLQRLVEQQLQLTRREIEEELRQRAAAAVIFVIGIAAFFLAATMACLSMSHLLHWVFSTPSPNPPRMPLWACHAATAAMLLIVGTALTVAGKARFQAVKSFTNPIVDILQEPVTWTTPRK